MPNEENMTPETEVQLSPAEMFMNDLDAASEDAPMTEAAQGDENAPVSEETVPEQLAEAIPPEMLQSTEESAAQPAPADNGQVEDMRNTIAALLDIVKQNQAAQATAQPSVEAAVEEAVEETEEEPFNEEEFNEKFYANPAGYIRDLAQQIADKKVGERLAGLQEELAPLLEESKAAQQRESIKTALNEFLDKTPDANEYFDSISAYVKENNLPTDDPRSFFDAYKESKINSQAALIDQLRQEVANGSRTLDDYLADENSVSQIVANDTVKAKVIENYLKELQEGGRPATIQSGGSIQSPGSPAVRPDSLRGAGEMFLRDLNR